MSEPRRRRRSLGRDLVACLGLLAAAGAGRADAPPGPPEVLTAEAAVAWALQYNPELAALRQQHGIAAAAVVIARTYPFNPTWTNKLFAVNGPESSGITNRVAMEQRVEIDLEVRHQGQYRRQAASAALTRTDWEIAFQEESLAVRVVRAFNTELYYRARLQLAEETVRLNRQTLEQVSEMVSRNLLRPPDRILAQSEVNSSTALLGAARGNVLRARQDVRRALGVTAEAFALSGSLQASPPPADAEALVPLALERRPDLHARQAAVAEADARLRLQIADRFGNPKLGPDYEYNETRDNFIGAEMVVPLPVFNTRKGEIMQRQAERTRAALDLRSTEVLIQQEVRAAADRLANARAWADSYRTQVLPDLEGSLQEVEGRFLKVGDVPLLTVIDIRRKLLQARAGYLDALWEVSQARADLAAAVGDPSLALDPPEAAPLPKP